MKKTKKKIVKGIIAVFAMALMLTTMVMAEEMNNSMDTSSQPEPSMAETVNQEAGLTVSLKFDKDPVKTGENEFTVTVDDSANKPVSGAEIKVTFDMDRSNMDTMGMEDPIVVTLKEDESGVYMGTVDLTDQGTWIAKTELTVAGQNQSKEFSFEVQSAGPNMIVIGGFLGAIVIIIIVAFAVKKKNSK